MCRSESILQPMLAATLHAGANSYMLVTCYNFSTDLEQHETYDPEAYGLRSGTNTGDNLCMLVETPMRKIEAGDIHAGTDKAFQHFRRVRCWTDGRP